EGGGRGGGVGRWAGALACPHQMPGVVEARIVGLRREHPGWGPSRIRWELERAGAEPLPGRSAVYRALIRHGLVDPKKRKRRREDYRRGGRGRGMELWEVDVMGPRVQHRGVAGPRAPRPRQPISRPPAPPAGRDAPAPA